MYRTGGEGRPRPLNGAQREAKIGGTTSLLEPSPLERLRARGRIRQTVALLGPAFVAAVAYVDPGNFATNISAGAGYGFLLLWVIVAANLMAMLVQYLSAKVGIATGRNLPELCREHLPRPVVWFLWIQAELVAMATDLAEFIGGALALRLLFGMPLFPAALVTAAVAFVILALQTRGYRRFELAIASLLGIVLVGFLYEMFASGPSTSAVADGLVPSFEDAESVLLATGILGATVMPHVIYLHSALTQDRVPARDEHEVRELLRFERIDVVIAMSLAGAANAAMLIVAATLFHGQLDVGTIEEAHAGFGTLLGGGAALAFAVALMASGFSSSSVGTYAGQVVMQGFLRRSLPLTLRRLVTMVPPLAVIGAGFDPTRALVISQVVLSFGIPFALVPLVFFTARRRVMGRFANAPLTTAAAAAIALLVSALNIFLLARTLGVA